MSNIETIIRKNYKKALSLNDLLRGANGRINIIVYKDIPKYKSIYEMLSPYNCCIILYQTKPNYGHWVAILRHGKNIEHFDPYGYSIDEELINNNPMNLPPYLTQLILKSRVPYVKSNITQFQKSQSGVNTCGRWALIRCLMKHKSLEDFTDLFHKLKLEPDFYITALTMFI